MSKQSIERFEENSKNKLSDQAHHVFDEAISLEKVGQNRFKGRAHPAYENMVGPFGGVTAAVLLQSVLQHPDCIGDPIALTVNYASPVALADFEIESHAVKTNRSTQHWMISLIQEGEVVASATAVIAKRRDTWSTHEAQPPKDVPAPESIQRMSPEGRFTWFGRYDIRVIDADSAVLDEVERDHSETSVWMRDYPPRPIDFLSLTGLCDVFFPRIFIRRRKRVPIGTVSMTIYFHADRDSLLKQSDQYVLGTARANRFRNGFFDQSAEVWSRDGELLATTHQIVYYKE